MRWYPTPIKALGQNGGLFAAQGIRPATTTHSQLSEEELVDMGIKPNTIRLSIGTEHIDDIIADLKRGFEAVK